MPFTTTVELVPKKPMASDSTFSKEEWQLLKPRRNENEHNDNDDNDIKFDCTLETKDLYNLENRERLFSQSH